MPDAAGPRSAAIPVAVATLLVAAAAVLVAALATSGSIEDRLADDDVAAVRAAIATQATAARALQPGEVITGARPLIPIAEGARARAGGTIRITSPDGVLLLQTDSFTRTDTREDVAAAFRGGHWTTRVIGPPGSRQRITAVPFRARGGPLAIIALTPARHERAADAARDAIRRGAVLGVLAAVLLTGACALYFRRKALIRSPKRS